jgi:acyl carrier protein
MKVQKSQEVSQANSLENAEVALSRSSKSVTEIQAWIVAYLAELLEVDSEEVDVKIPFDRYGLDSSAAIGMTGDLENWLGYSIDPTLIYDYPTIESFARHLTEGF